MNSRGFSLKPFPSSGLLPDLKITGSIERNSNALSISYLLSGPMDGILLPAPADISVRKKGLWEETCLEFFLGEKGSEQYWEFNLSPSGHWNVYRFNSYRQGMREESAFTSFPFSVKFCPDSLLLSLVLELDKFIPAERAPEVFQVGISTVVKTRDGRTTYWALVHPGPQADFHRRDGFIIEL